MTTITITFSLLTRIRIRMIWFKLHFSLLILILVSVARLISANADNNNYNRNDFPSGFIFGAATSAYQVEGAALEDGRTPSSADAYAHGYFEGNVDVACDHYHKYKEDIQLMVDTGLEAYRFSISWSRLIPNGRGPVNPKGLEFYNNLINELIRLGIEPHATLYHLDLPLALADEYGGFSNPRIVEDFTAYADVCFREFGDRVRHWSTVNEANLFAMVLNRDWIGPAYKNVTAGTYDSYLIGHHVLLAHASAARLYRKNYQAKQQGLIGITLYTFYFTPFSNSTEDVLATRRSYTFFVDWFMHPLTHGDYDETMKRVAGEALPAFTKSDSESLKGSFDFIGLNYYSEIKIKYDPSGSQHSLTENDMKAVMLPVDGSDMKQGAPFPNTPWGLQGILEHFKNFYDNPRIYIHENGQSTNYSTTLVDDTSRVEYLRDHIGGLLESVRNGSNAKGYFVWSFLDVFEFLFGYRNTFGLYHVDYNDSNLRRTPKLSQKWYSDFLKGGNITIETETGSMEDNVSTFLRKRLDEVSEVRTW